MRRRRLMHRDAFVAAQTKAYRTPEPIVTIEPKKPLPSSIGCIRCRMNPRHMHGVCLECLLEQFKTQQRA
jgi:hypothetical protein